MVQRNLGFIGAANLDHIAIVPRIPKPDERVVSHPFLSAGGGPAATAAVAAARQGCDVSFIGIIGADPAGDMVRAELQLESVGTALLESRDFLKTAESIVLIEGDTGLRSIVTEETPSPVVLATPLDVFTWIHVDHVGYRAVRDASREHPLSAKVSLDGGNPIEGLSLECVDLYAPTRVQILSRYPGLDLPDAIRAASAEGPALVVVTAGSEGAWYLEDGAIEHISAFNVPVISTLGAGDVFHGALVARVAHGDSLRTATIYASATAALSCRGIDGRSAIPRPSEVHSFLRNSSGEIIG